MIEKGDKETGESKPFKPTKKKVRPGAKGAHRKPRLSARPKKLKAKGTLKGAKKDEPVSEAKEMLRRIEEMYTDLEEKLHYVYDHMHLLPVELQKIVHQPDIFFGEHEEILRVFEEDL
ncbi:MAG: hypothetical protein AAGG81_08385, partial [Chlamydiota bacterium]